MRRFMSFVWVVMIIVAGPVAAQISYDTCDDPYPVPPLPTACMPNTTNANIDYTGPLNCSSSYGKDEWFRYTPSQDGVLAVDTLGSFFDTVLAVLSGSCGNLNYICCDNNSGGSGQALLALPVTAGVDYNIVLWGDSGASGTAQMNFYAPQPPTVTSFGPSSATVGSYVNIWGTNFLGTTGTTAVKFNGAPAHSIESLSKTLLRAEVPHDATAGFITVETLAGSGKSSYTFSVEPSIDHFSPPSGPVGTLVTISGYSFNQGANQITGIRFNNTPCVAYTVVSANEITATVPPGATTGPIVIDTVVGQAISSTDFVVQPPPQNDLCANAIVITPASLPYTNTQQTALATSDGDPLMENCDSTAGNGVWYTYTPPSGQDQCVVAHTYGSDFETSLAAYSTLSPCWLFTQVACDTTEPGSAARIEFNATGGTTYYFLAAGKKGATGSLRFSLHADDSISHTDTWSGASGGWDNPGTWDNNQVPGASATVNIPTPSSGSATITVQSSVSIKTLNLGGGTGWGSVKLSIPPGVELVVTGNVVIAPGCVLNVEGGSLTVEGVLDNQGELILGSPGNTEPPPPPGSAPQSPLRLGWSVYRPLVGSSPTTGEMPLVTLAGGFNGQSGSSLKVYVASQSYYGRMSVSGQAKLNGTLTLLMMNGFVPPDNCPFSVLYVNHGICDSSCAPTNCKICSPTSCTQGICGSFSSVTASPSLSPGYLTQAMTSKTMNGTNYFYWVITSHGTVAKLMPSPGEIKPLADGASVPVLLGTVTLVQSAANCFYIQEPLRSGGIRVDTAGIGQIISGRAVQLLDCLQIGGNMGTRKIGGVSSERQVVANSLVRLTQVAPSVVGPMSITCSALGGGYIPDAPGVEGGVGLNNIGLLVKITGTVIYKNETVICVDDASAAPDTSGLRGVMVNLPGGAPAMRVGSFVSIVGVVQGYIPPGGTANRRVICTRIASDVTVLSY